MLKKIVIRSLCVLFIVHTIMTVPDPRMPQVPKVKNESNIVKEIVLETNRHIETAYALAYPSKIDEITSGTYKTN